MSSSDLPVLLSVLIEDHMICGSVLDLMLRSRQIARRQDDEVELMACSWCTGPEVA